MNNETRKNYRNQLSELIGKKIKVIIDRPIGYKHGSIIYTLNYGYTELLTALDGEFQDVYILNETEPLKEYEGIVIGIIYREDDIEDKLLVARDTTINEEEIEKQVAFQEQFFVHKIIK